MGRRHVTYGTKPGHYATIVKALLQTLGECLEKDFTPEMETAWRRALEFVAETMQRGAAHVHVLKEGGNPPAMSRGKAGACPFQH